MSSLPPITRNLLIANVMCYLLHLLFETLHIDLPDSFALPLLLPKHLRDKQLIN